MQLGGVWPRQRSLADINWHNIIQYNTIWYCTFRENTTEHGAEWTPTRYAQLDFWLVGEKWAKSCKDVTARPDVHFPSDHYIVESTIRIKLPGFKENPRPRPKFRQPTTQEWNNYNQQLKEQLGDVIDPNRDLDSWDNFAEIIFRTACNPLSQITPRQKRNYISRRTWNLIEQRQSAHEAENHQVVKELTRQIKKNARKDRKDTILNSLKELPDARETWQGVKDLKREPQPQFIRLRDLNGELVAPKDRAETIATYLEQKHWNNPSEHTMPRSDALQRLQDQFNVGQFTLLEFDQALKTTKNNKQAGPDGIAMELFKWMDAENRNFLLNIINHWWRHKQAPESIFRARVVSIFKKGDTDLPENYRPISLLTTIYNIYMIMIRKRLQVVLEDHLCETQYGFRPSWSTSHAIFLTRRLQDISEQQGSNMILLFLDWEKAFDRIKHDRLWIALQRLGIHEHFIDVLQDGYRKASFFVEDEYGASQTKKQRAGIRQGCLLSPYLFVLLMSIVDEDVKYRLQNPQQFPAHTSGILCRWHNPHCNKYQSCKQATSRGRKGFPTVWFKIEQG